MRRQKGLPGEGSFLKGHEGASEGADSPAL